MYFAGSEVESLLWRLVARLAAVELAVDDPRALEHRTAGLHLVTQWPGGRLGDAQATD